MWHLCSPKSIFFTEHPTSARAPTAGFEREIILFVYFLSEEE